MILTNRVELEFDYQAILRDFVIFEARRDGGNFKGSKIPDIALQECKAVAVVYEWGSSCYILYHRNLAEKYAIKNTLENYDGDIRVHESTCEELKQMKKHYLGQLLFNAIPNLASNQEMYHNITGGLYYSNPEWIHRRKGELNDFWMLQISLTWDFCVNLKVKTFSNVKQKQDTKPKAQYLFDSTSFWLRRALKEEEDPNAERFVLSSHRFSKKNTVPFLLFGSLKEFHKCKVGVLHRFLKDVKIFLAPYLTMQLKTMDETTHIGDRRVDTKMMSIRRRLEGIPLYLEDTVQNEQSAILKNMLCWELSNYSKIYVAEGKPKKGDALIRIIHNKEYFADCPEQDNYKDAPKDCIVQHVTVEDFNLNDDGTRKEDCNLRTVIQELAIKMDVAQGYIYCYDWVALGFTSSVFFVSASKSGEKPIQYNRLCIEPDGALHFDRWEQPMIFTDAEQEKIAQTFENHNGKFDFSVKGVIYETIDQIHIIRDTEYCTIPNLDVLEKILSGTREEELLPLAPILGALEKELVLANGNKISQYQMVRNELISRGKEINRRELKDILNLRTNFGKELNELIYRETGILISGRMKERKNRETIFGGVLDIRHFSSETAQFYYSGYRGESLKYSFPHACRIRKVTSTGEILQFEKYLPLLEVDFVRANAWTVIPFPFKYLREWKGK